MKRIGAILILIAALFCCIGATAYAETVEEHVKQLAMQNDKVTACECVIYKRACVIAIKTEKFTTKSEYDEYVDNLIQQIKTDCEADYVYVSRSPKLMFKLAELSKMEEGDREKAIEKIIEEQLHRRERGEKPIMPRFLDDCARNA